MAQARGFRTIKFELKKGGEAAVFTSPKTADALEKMIEKMDLYEGVKLTQVLEAVYLQGKKDGAREVFDNMDRKVAEVKKAIPHLRPGRPRKRN